MKRLWYVASVAGLLAGSSALRAQETRLLTWQGQVDREARITVRGARASVELEGRDRQTAVKLARALPPRAGQLRAVVRAGRGRADVLQQPTAANRYTAIVRISDPRSGADRYTVDLVWQPAAATHRGAAGAPFPRSPNSGIMGSSPGRAPGSATRAAGSVMHWAGEVDGEVQVRWRGRGVAYRNLSGATPREVAATVRGAGLPSSPVTVRVRRLSGRGEIVVVQQPSRANDYTAIIRVKDSQRGFGRYEFEASW